MSTVRRPIEKLPLSFAEERIWFLDRLEPGSQVFNIPYAFRLHGILNVPALEQSLRELVQRHEVLRTTYVGDQGQPCRVITREASFQLGLTDIHDIPPAQMQSQALRLAEQEAALPFDLARDLMLRARLLRLADDDHVLVLTLHHIASDGWSSAILWRELSALYEAFSCGSPSPLVELPLQYADYAASQRESLQGDVLKERLAHWQNHLAGCPALLELPTDFPRPAVQRSEGGWCEAVIDADLVRALQQFRRREGSTLFMTLLAAWQVLLWRHSGQADFVVSVPTATRNRPEVEGLIGCFLNLLPLRADLSGEPSFRTLLRRVRGAALSAFEHQDFPLERHMEALRLQRAAGRLSLFQVLFNLWNYSKATLVLPGVSVEPLKLRPGGVNADLELYALEQGDQIELYLAYRRDLFLPGTVDQILQQFRTLLESICRHPNDPISKLMLIDAENNARLQGESQACFPTRPFREFRREEIEQSIPARFEQQVKQGPDRPAVKTRGYRWTYGQLNQSANRIAHKLVDARGGGAECVALLLDHDAPMVAAILGVLKAGKTYVPLEPSHPKARLASILTDAGAKILLTDDAGEGLARELTPKDGMLVNVDAIPSTAPAEDLQLTISPDAPAYLLYTSGSTGVPKGVVQNHRNVLHFMRLYTNNLRLDVDDRLSLFSSYGYDAAVMDIYAALLNGAALYPLDVKGSLPQSLVDAVRAEGITVFHSTPTLFRLLLSCLPAGEVLPAVRAVVLGGEQAMRRDVDLYRRHFSGECVLVNGLGPTECTVALQNFMRRETPMAGQAVPVGYPLEDMEISLLDERGQANEVSGEIAIRSRHVALGYWNRPDLTKERFLPDPDGGDRRIYLTGDLARRRPDGRLEYLGRKDQQVKISGNRIELSEIEVALARHPTVARAAVIARPTASGDRELVAYVVPITGSSQTALELLSAATMREHLRTLLPDYMIPTRLMILEQLPLMPNGKLDRAALPDPGVEREVIRIYVAPRSKTEHLLAGIWRGVLGLEQVGIHDDFFDLGGHSLLATRVIAGVHDAFTIHLPLRSVFEAPTIAQLATLLDPTTATVDQAGNAGGAAPGDATKLAGGKCSYREIESEPFLIRGKPVDPNPFCETIRMGNGGVPLICIGDSRPVRAILQKLPNDTPVIQLKLDGAHIWPPRYLTAAEQLDIFRRLLEARCVEKRVALVGFSYGGTLAYQLAALLMKCGWSQAGVVLIEPITPFRFQRFWRTRLLKQRVRKAMSPSGIRARFRKPSAKIDLHPAAPQLPADPDSITRWLTMRLHYLKNVESSKPRRLKRPIALVGSEAYHARYADRWKRGSVGGIEPCIFTGTRDHFACVRPPYAEQWVRFLERWYEKFFSC